MTHDPLNGKRWDVVHGDCVDVLKGYADASVDSVVTDCPYGLSSHDKLVPQILRAWLDGSDAADVASRLRGFMGREWDALPPSPVVWREVLRVLKPGGHCLAFGGARTSHLVAIGLQLAGFEIRDAIEVSGLVSAAHLLWVQSQGFPKGHNVSKAIDKEAGAVREVVGHSPDAAARQPGRAMNPGGNGLRACVDERAITAPATPEAAAWEGWDVALSPSQEPVVVARKPLAGTVAANVLATGCGALNIDGCRVPTTQADRDLMASRSHPHGTKGGANGGAVLMQFDKPDGFKPSPQGRWPSNFALCHSPACTPTDCAPDCPVRALGEQSGERASGSRVAGVRKGVGYGSSARGDGGPAIEASTGDAARFFPSFRYTDADAWPFRYVPKASRAEREAGLYLLNSTEHVMLAETVELEPQERNVWESLGLRRVIPAASDTQHARDTIVSAFGIRSPRIADLCSLMCERGRRPTGRFLTAIRYTTSTATNRTIASKIYDLCQRWSTSESTTAANYETASGTNRAESAESSSRSDRSTGTSAAPAIRSTVAAGPATSPESFATNALAEIETACSRKPAHPTVKPVALMAWLVRLVTPPGGLVIDPWCGSGTTGIAALREGMRFLGIERDPVTDEDVPSVHIARARIGHTVARPLGYRSQPERAEQLDLLPAASRNGGKP